MTEHGVTNTQLRHFVDYFGDYVLEYHDWYMSSTGKLDLDAFIDEIYESELNFNNADVECGQRVYDWWEVKELFTAAINLDHCIECGAGIDSVVRDLNGWKCWDCHWDEDEVQND